MPEEEKIYCSMYSRNAELYHHGIKGQKWGVQNGPPYPLGSDVSTGSRLKKTDSRAGEINKKDISTMDTKKKYRYLKSEVRKKRKEELGSGNQWATLRPIGKESKKIISEWDENLKKYYDSEEYKKWSKEWDKIQEQVEWGEITYDEYDKRTAELRKSAPKMDFVDLAFVKVYDKNGVHYRHNYLNKGGMAITVAYLKDLGYSDKEASMYAKEMAKKGYTLGDA